MAKRYDEDESILRTLKDGERMYFSMMTMDSEVLPARDATTDATAPLRVVDAFGNSGLALNKPGSRHLAARKGTPDNAAMVMRDHQCREARDLRCLEKHRHQRPRSLARAQYR